MKRNPWHPVVQAALRRALPRSLYLRYVGRHEEGSLRLWRDLARKVPPGGAILDIGAYRGEYALAAREANVAAAIYAFEPNPVALEDLHRNCAGKNVSIEAVALSDKTGIVTFTDRGQRSRMATEGPIHVSAVTLAEWVTAHGITPSLMKVDTEGSESLVFRGAQTLLAVVKPTIICEVLSDRAGLAVMDALTGYRYFRIDENKGPEERKRITREHWRHKNWLLVPVKHGSSP